MGEGGKPRPYSATSDPQQVVTRRTAGALRKTEIDAYVAN
jgi:hypothetical protein